jgi:protein-S-isoprenylcysteine O-methyltransferase Ste14
MHVVAIAVGVAWVAFWAYWLAAAARTRGDSRDGARFPQGRYAGIRLGVIVLLALLVRAKVFGIVGITSDGWVQAIGAALFVCGLSLAIWARRYLGRNWGTPRSQKIDPELVTSGPYRRVRHPIYSGLLLALLGTALAVSWYWAIAGVVLGAYFIYCALEEERYMATKFPDTYPKYRRSTKMMIPFVF